MYMKKVTAISGFSKILSIKENTATLDGGGISFYLKEIISCYREISHNKER